MFVCGFPPYKASLKLTPLASYSAKEIEKAAEEQEIKPPPKLPAGKFVVIKNNMKNGSMIHVALYKFRHAKGCGVTESDVHRSLGVPVENHKSRDVLTKRKQTPKTRVGSYFLYNQDVSYSCEANTVRIEVETENQAEEATVGSCEDSRCAQLMHNMRKLYPECVIKVWANNNHFCPFKGGGDIVIYKNTHAAACLTTNPEIALAESPASSRECTASPDAPAEYLVPPPGPTPDTTKDISQKKLGEHRHGAIEAKYSHPQTARAATLQLQANMLLLTSALLHSKITAGEEDITLMTSYGVLMGREYPLKVVKLSVCFAEQLEPKIHRIQGFCNS